MKVLIILGVLFSDSCVIGLHMMYSTDALYPIIYTALTTLFLSFPFFRH